MTVPVATFDLNRTLDVWRPLLAADGAGGDEVDMVPAGTVRGRVSQPSAAERVAAMQAGADHTHAVYLRPDADVYRGDELRGDGQTFRVKATFQPSEPVYLRADVELVESEPPSAES